jgi:hypothetical protein
MIWPIILVFSLAGCGGSQDEPAGEPTKQSSDRVLAPELAVFDFLEAVRTGDNVKASAVLTKTVRQETAARDLVVAPPGSETASFEVGAVEYVGDEGAHVASTWTDIGDDGRPEPSEFLWVLRREPEGWRIAGVIYKVFDDAPPLILNFEDPDDMQRKQKLLAQEMMRRAKAESSQARQPSGQSHPR